MLSGLEVTDPHHHLWDLQANRYPWLTGPMEKRICGDYTPIRCDYLVSDFLRDAAEIPLIRSVHVEAAHDRSDPVRETRWLQSLAEAPGSGGFPHGIIAYCDLARSDATSVLEAHAAHPNLRGVRQMLHETRLNPGSFGSPLYEDLTWRSNLHLVQKLGLTFDLQLFPEQLADGFELVSAYPDLMFVLCHTGTPLHRDPEGLLLWRQGVRLLASAPNVRIKISGFGMFDRSWTTESIRPFVIEAIESFGPLRSMFASNFPVDRMMASYGRLWLAYDEITAGFSPEERQALFSGTARRTYRV